jgi:hypothetical protein
MMNDLGRFDEAKASIRLIRTISYTQGSPTPRLELLNYLSQQGVGRTAAYRDINLCKNLGLIEERSYKNQGKRIISLHLTEKGIAILSPILEMAKILNE